MIRLATIAALGAAAALAGTAIKAKPASAPRTAITCTWPVRPSDSARSLLRRFGRPGPRGRYRHRRGRGPSRRVLFPNDPRRRMEVLFWDSSRRSPRQVQFSRRCTRHWTVTGIRLGDSLGSVRRRNGRADDHAACSTRITAARSTASMAGGWQRCSAAAAFDRDFLRPRRGLSRQPEGDGEIAPPIIPTWPRPGPMSIVLGVHFRAANGNQLAEASRVSRTPARRSCRHA